MNLSATVRWMLLALAGLAIAIVVAIAAANLAGQQIGIASESVSAGDALAPSLSVPAEAKHRDERRGDHGHDKGETTPVTPVEPGSTTAEESSPPPEEAAEPRGEGGSDDSGGQGSDGDD